MMAALQKIVRKLTPVASRRRETGAFGLIVAVSLLATGSALAFERHPTADITATAESFLLARMDAGSDDTTLAAAGFDDRHRLARCDRPLQGFLRRGMEIQSRTIVGVRCSGSRPWKVYVPVEISVSATVLVAARNLPAGHVLEPGDAREERRNVSTLRRGYLSDVAQLAGQRLRSPLLAGRVLTPAVLAADRIVRRGQSVTLIAASGGITINMSGRALSDGGLNQRIRVENTNSGRVVEGIVRSREQVEVLIPAQTGFFHAKPKVSPRVADTGFSNNDR